MSAIVGIYYRDKRPIDQNVLDNMMTSLVHRGGDGNDVWVNGHVGIGHQMHWITPESLTEKLPLYDSGRRLTITADARIDNRNDLFSKLAVPSKERRTISDSQLIMYAYEKWGESCVDHLIGDFVFAIWDSKNQKFFCVTDPLGHRPVYYYIDQNIFAFASEIKALLKLPQVPNQLNEEQFARNLTYELSLQEKEETCFKGIFRLKSGHVMTVTAGKAKQKMHGQPDFNKKLKLKDEAEYLEAFRELFDEAVYSRMRSAYPVACMLSGGLDSSSIASVAAKKLQKNNTQLIGLAGMLPENHKGPEKDERYFIELMSKRWNINLFHINHPDNGIYHRIEQACMRVEHPFVDTRHYHYQAFQYEAEKHDARVILDGYGGELSGSSYANGYYSELLRTGKWSLLGRELRDQSQIDKCSAPSIFLKQVLRPFAPNWLEYWYYKQQHDYDICAANSVMRPEFARRMKVSKQLKIIGEIFKIHPNVSKNDQISYDLVRSETFRLFNPRRSQILYPYLDKRLLEFCFSIPPRLKVNNGWKRQLIRSAMEDMLPDQVQWRTSKLPFSPDHPSRMKASEPEARQILANVGKNEPIRNYIDISRLSRLLEQLSRQPVLSHNDVYELDSAASLVQAGIYAIVFSRVFREVF